MTGHVTRSLTSLSGRFPGLSRKKISFYFSTAWIFVSADTTALKPTVSVDTHRLAAASSVSPSLRLHLAPRLAEELGSHCLPLVTPRDCTLIF